MKKHKTKMSVFHRKSHSAFTLVELLVVIAIIGILVALLLPAIQAAREAARRTQCTNQLKQLGLGFHLHHDTHGYLPTVGWGWNWIGDPDLGFDEDQPGGWHFNVLPYIEQSSLRDMAQGVSAASKPEILHDMMQIPLATFQCPSRRAALLRPTGPDPIHNAVHPENNSKVDYGINCGSVFFAGTGGPRDINSVKRFRWPEPGRGIASYYITMPLKSITDGTSHTIMLGEKYMDADQYEDGEYCTDDQGLFYGLNCDDQMFSNRGRLPQMDTPGLHLQFNWGSAHPGTWHVAFCDGSVRGVSYDIEWEVFAGLCDRDDGELVDSDF